MITCAACIERRDHGHTYDAEGCCYRSPSAVRARAKERARQREERVRGGDHPDYDSVEERRGDK